MGRLTNYFFPPPAPVILEIDKRPPLPNTADVVAATSALVEAPGMKFLLAKLDLDRAKLIQTLAESRHQDLREVQYLQAGVYWCGWLQRQLSYYLRLQEDRARAITPEEDTLHKAMTSTLELIGIPPQEES